MAWKGQWTSFMNSTAETVFITGKMLVGLTDLYVEFCCSSSLYKIGMILLMCLRCSSFSENFQSDTESESFFCWKSVDRFIAILSSNVTVFMPVTLIQQWLMALNHLHCQSNFLYLIFLRFSKKCLDHLGDHFASLFMK